MNPDLELLVRELFAYIDHHGQPIAVGAVSVTIPSKLLRRLRAALEAQEHHHDNPKDYIEYSEDNEALRRI